MNKDDTVIDWEFAFAAPLDFLISPSWWLLLKAPGDWPEGLDDWVVKYEPDLAVFLRAPEIKEKEERTLADWSEYPRRLSRPDSTAIFLAGT